ncbi:hypothetical protein HaLaN_04674 [Haematococcus lacustris]|uniref:Uncharacterized protein n=1 Tax=Haematococcus lacustris TaxID=44745 RepID=A0A699YJT3_HAELA|nr:hypothetical protein HaLaN_04674 [Haematococcus lacustris]
MQSSDVGPEGTKQTIRCRRQGHTTPRQSTTSADITLSQGQCCEIIVVKATDSVKSPYSVNEAFFSHARVRRSQHGIGELHTAQ